MGNVKLSAHNFVAITLIAAVGMVVLRLGAGTGLGQLPVVGPALRWLSTGQG
jgi:hypothetical protein